MERVSIIFLWLILIFFPTKNSFSNTVPAEQSFSAALPALRSFSAGGLNETVTRANTFSIFEENGKVGLKDEQGQILIPAMYDAIGWSNGKLSIVDKVVGYQSDGLWGLIHTANRLITPAEYLELVPGGASFFVAKKKSDLSQLLSCGIIDASGKPVIPFSYDGLELSNMRAVVMSRTGTRYIFGLTDLSHKILIPLEFQRIYSLGSLRYAVENFENKTAIFSEDGTQITDFRIDSISSFKKDYAIVYQNQRQGLINRSGQFILEPTYREVKVRNDGSIQARQIDSWFFLDGQNSLIKQYRADAINPLSPDHYAIEVSGKFQLTNNTFTPLHADYFSSLSIFQKSKALYRNAGKTGLIDTEGKILIPAKYNQLMIDPPYLLASLDIGYKTRWILLDSSGNTLSEKHYEHILPFNGKFFPVRNRGYWGAVNAEGKEIVTCVHDSLVQQTGNHIVVKFRGEFGIINLRENWIITPQAKPLKVLNDEMYFEYAGKTTFLKSLTGNIIYFSDNPLEYKTDHLVEHLPSGAFWKIDMNGTLIDRSAPSESAEQIFQESEGLRAIRKDGKYGFIDDHGRLRIANRYDDVQPFSTGLAAIKIRNKWGFIDRQENLIAQPVYDEVSVFNNGYAIVRQNNLSGIIDKNGKLVLPVRYDEILLTKEKRFILKQDGLYGMADAEGTIIIHPKYDDLSDTRNGYVIIQRKGKYGLLTLRGVSTIPMIYDGLIFDPHHNQYMAVKKSSWETVGGPQSTVHRP